MGTFYESRGSTVMFQHLFSKRGFTLNNFHLLLELEEGGSLVKAAKGDVVRQTLYSRQIKQLSEYFGVPLTERQGRELKLTEHGRRLARVAREMFLGVDDFRRSCLDQQLSVTIGAGDSLLQWLLLPRMRPIQEQVKNAHFTLLNLRNDQIAERLSELKLDFGVMRENGIPPKHRKERLFQLQFGIFVPKRLLPTRDKANYKYVLENVPLVRHNPGGELVNHIALIAQQEGIILNDCLTCEGFPQACRAVQSGRYGAILPTIAKGDFKPGVYVEIEWPALKAEARWIALVWNPRQVTLRTGLEKVGHCLKTELMKGI